MINPKIMILCLSVFSITQVYANQITAETARNQLKPEAMAKIKSAHIDLNSLVNNESNDLIVEFNNNTLKQNTPQSMQQIRNGIANLKLAINRRFQNDAGLTRLRDYNALALTVYRVKDRTTLVKLLNDPDVKAVYPNRLNKMNMAQSLNLIQQPQAFNNKFDGDGSSVVVADTGVDYTHADFGNCSAINTPTSNCRVIQSFDTAEEDNQMDDHGHGTNVSAIVARVAPKTKIIAIDVFNASGSARDSDILAAINWATNNAQTYNIKAINFSLGVSDQNAGICQNSYTTPFSSARAAGIIPVVASGNDGFTEGISTPACTAGAVSVGAVYDSSLGSKDWSSCTDSITSADKIICFSNSGPRLSLLAPGSIINAGGYAMSGTSQATPHVAGAIAVLRANNVSPSESIDQTIRRLQTTGTPITDPRNNLRFSRIDLMAATTGLNVN